MVISPPVYLFLRVVLLSEFSKTGLSQSNGEGKGAFVFVSKLMGGGPLIL